MLYDDYKIELPKAMPDPEYKLRLQPYKDDSAKTVVLYLGSSKRDPASGKLIHPKRVSIGKSVEEDGKLVMIPNEQYFNFFCGGKQPPAASKVTGRGRPPKDKPDVKHADDSVVAFGHALAWINEAKKLGLYSILINVFGAEKALQMLTVAAFYAFENERGLTLLDKFVKNQMSFAQKKLNSQRACELFASIEEPELKSFFEQWIELKCGKDCCFYDVASISYTGDGIVEVARGYNRDKEDLPQVNIGLFVSSTTRLPLFYCNYQGSINDFSNFPYVMSQAKFMGLTGKITVAGDKIFSEPGSASKAYKLGYDLLVGMQIGHSHELRQKLLQWRKSPNHKEEIAQSPADGIVAASSPFKLKDIDGMLFMYKQDETASLEWAGLRAAIKDISAMIAKGQDTSPKLPCPKIRRFCDTQKINSDGKSLYKFALNNDKIQDAMDLCGCFAIFTTQTHLDPFAGLDLYRALDVCEKNFANLKNELMGERLPVHSSKAWHGKLFILFLSLIIRTSLFNTLRPWISKSKTSLKDAFAELSLIKCRKQGERWILRKAVTKNQKELARMLGLPLDY